MNSFYDSCRARDPMTCFMMIYLENHLLEFVKRLVFCFFAVSLLFFFEFVLNM